MGTVGCQPEDGNLIFRRSLCGYVCVNILSLSPSETTANDEYDDKGYFTLTGPSQKK